MKTLHYSIILTLAISSILTISLTQHASGFLIAETPLQTYHGSNIILTGKIISLQKTGNFTEEYHYSIQVEEYIKNKQSSSTISVIASGSSIPSPPKFEIGDRVLLILDKENGDYVVSPNSFKTIPGCSSHEMLGFWVFPDEPLPHDTRSEFKANKNCISPLIQIRPSDDVFFSPLLQFKSGTSSGQVSCKQGMALVIKSEDNMPACVKPDTVQILIMRGWETFTVRSTDNTSDQKMNGTLSGNVVLAGGPSPGPQANYEVDVYAVDGTTIVGKTFSDVNAHYSIQLLAGNYTIYVPDYPDKQTHFISVFSGKNTTFNIAYGTGYK